MSTMDVLSWTCFIIGIVAGLQWLEIRRLRRRIESVNVTMWALTFAQMGVLDPAEATVFGPQTTPPDAMKRLTGPRIIEQRRKLEARDARDKAYDDSLRAQGLVRVRPD